ncbi:MAG: ABC transporter ATP-binding protein [Actinobacteria bacterium]|nr:ABC transporter ATP-binding protein [Actinomycetota bacterium]
MLEVESIEVFYGNIRALEGVSFTVDEGEVVTLLGANGAGKSTTLRTISGLLTASRGSIRFRGREIDRLRSEEVVALGISHSPEGRHCFQRMTVRENLDLGAYLRRDGEIEQDVERVYELFPRLAERRRQKAGTMSGGEQQMLAIGRALMARPELLLLDEPSMGIAPVLVDKIYETIEQISGDGMTILLVEQNANRALSVSDRGYVLETGRVVLSASAEQLGSDPEVQAAYLGGD